jgi:hypothetical protein
MEKILSGEVVMAENQILADAALFRAKHEDLE